MDERSISLAGLKAFSIRDAAAPGLTIVFLHGRGMRPSDLTPFAHSLAIPGAAYVFPQAPLAEPGGGFSWWHERGDEGRLPGAVGARDLAHFVPQSRHDVRSRLSNLLGELRRSGDGGPLLLAGFSQGGMLACDLLIMEGAAVAGLALMSASRIAVDDWSARGRRLDHLPVFISHGRADADLAFSAGERLRDFLDGSGAAVDWLPFDGGHEIPFTVWRQFRQFTRALYSAGSATNGNIASYGTH